jgi:hypothetical protein
LQNKQPKAKRVAAELLAATTCPFRVLMPQARDAIRRAPISINAVEIETASAMWFLFQTDFWTILSGDVAGRS